MDRHWHKTSLRKVWKPLLLSLVIFLVASISISPISNASAASIVGSNINNLCASGVFSCAVTVPPGGTSYFYAATEGGAFNISPIDFVQDLGVTNPGGDLSVIIGHSSSNTGTFNPGGAFFPMIGGIGITGTPTHTISFSKGGAGSMSGTFSLAQNSLVVLVSASSNNNSPVTLSSPFSIDDQASNTLCNFGTGCGGVVLAHATMSSGIQSFSITYSSVAPGFQNTPAEAIGVVLYIFPISQTPVGGVIVPVDMTSLFIAGISANAVWMVPTLGGIVGAALAFFKIKRKQE